MNNLYRLMGILFAVFILLSSSVYVLDQRHSSLVLQFGDPIAQHMDPGLKFKIPLLQNVVIFDKRIQHLSFSPDESTEVMAMDQKTMKLDAFAKYRIIDPLKFYQSVQTEQKLKMRIGSVIESSIREVIGTVLFIDILGNKRDQITARITDLVKKQAKNFGIEILDVRIIRVNLPDKARSSVYQRMRTERQKEAMEIRATGSEEANIIRATAERERTILLAEAKKTSEILKGTGDAAATEIFASAANKDPKFFSFYRSLKAYENSFASNNSSIVLSSDSPFMKHFGGSNSTSYGDNAK